MKKFLAILLATLLMLSAAAAEHYTFVGVVTNVDDGIATFVAAGNEWQFFEPDADIGDIMSFLMNDMGTEEPFDDEILDYRYEQNLFDVLEEMGGE